MELKDQNLLFFTRTMQVGGTEKVILQLCRILQPYVHKIVVCSNGGIYEKELEKMNISHYLILDIECKNPVTICQVLKTIRCIIKKEKITIVHTHHRMAAFYVSILRRIQKVVFINTVHNTFHDKVILSRIAYKGAKLIACGESVKDNLIHDFKINEKHIKVIHNAVEEAKGEKEDIECLNNLKKSGYWLVGNVGRLSEQKGMKHFVQAYPRIKESMTNVKFVIVGDGEEKQSLLELVKELQIEEDILFLGYRDDVQNVMRYFDFIVVSSLWEGFPLTPIEAFSVKKTVIASNVKGTAEIVQDGINGYLVEKKDAEQLAEKILFLMNNPHKKSELEENAYESYITKYGLESFREKILTFYREI